MYIPPGLMQSSTATGNQLLDQGSSTTQSGSSAGSTFTFNEAEIQEYILGCQNESEETYSDVRLIWNELWQQYRGIQDNTKKKDWQSKLFIQESGPACEKFASVLQRILIQNKKYFDLEKRGGPSTPGMPDPIKHTTEENLRLGQIEALRYHTENAGFMNLFKEAFLSIGVLGIGIMKLWWEPFQKESVQYKEDMNVDWKKGFPNVSLDAYFEKVIKHSSRLQASVINPRMCWWDSQRTFFIEESTTTLPDIMRLAEVGIYDMDQVNKLKSDYGKDATETKRLTDLGLMVSENYFRKQVHLYEFWGDLLDEDGLVTKRNCRVVLANKQYVLNPQNLDNPFWHRNIPYVVCDPIKVLFRKDGRALIEGVRSLQKTINDMSNMAMDGLLFKLAKIIEVDPDMLRYPEQLRTLRPGKPILKKGNAPVIQEVQFSDIPQGSMMEVENLRRSHQNYTGITDFLLGNPQVVGGKATATEVQQKSGESNALFAGIGACIERDLIEPSIEMARQLAIQFWDDFEDPVLQDIAQKYGAPFNGPREKRVSFINTNHKVIVRGISSYFQKKEELSNYMNLLGIIGKVPPFLQRIKIRNLLDRILDAFSIPDVRDLLIDDNIEILLQKSEMFKMMMEIMPPPQPGMPPPGGPPLPGQSPGAPALSRPPSERPGMGPRRGNTPQPGMIGNKQTVTNMPMPGMDNNMNPNMRTYGSA